MATHFAARWAVPPVSLKRQWARSCSLRMRLRFVRCISRSSLPAARLGVTVRRHAVVCPAQAYIGGVIMGVSSARAAYEGRCDGGGEGSAGG